MFPMEETVSFIFLGICSGMLLQVQWVYGVPITLQHWEELGDQNCCGAVWERKMPPRKDQSYSLKEFSWQWELQEAALRWEQSPAHSVANKGWAWSPHTHRGSREWAQEFRGNGEKTRLGRYHFSPGSCAMNVWPNFTCGFSHKSTCEGFLFFVIGVLWFFSPFQPYPAPLLLYF